MTDDNDEKPYWWPKIIDDAHLARLRKDYPEKAYMDDDNLLDYFEYGKEKGGFSDTWDDLKDAYSDYEPLARAFLALVRETGKTYKDFI